MERLLKWFERGVVVTLVTFMLVVTALSTLELGVKIAQDIYRHPFHLLDIEALLQIFGFFLLILIGVELLEIIKAYLVEHIVHVEVVLEVALIAVARKAIILDLKTSDPVSLLGLAAVIIALAGAFFLEKKSRSASDRKG